MSMKALLGAVVLSVVMWPVAGAQAPDSPDAELMRLERAKWGDPPGVLTPEAFKALVADDFVSVEYGVEVTRGVERKTREQVFAGPPLPPAKFELSEWHAIHANPDVVILSYKVTGVSFPWKAYATSTWTRRSGKWYTVFYQASTAR